jgi:hypothetical protein
MKITLCSFPEYEKNPLNFKGVQLFPLHCRGWYILESTMSPRFKKIMVQAEIS